MRAKLHSHFLKLPGALKALDNPVWLGSGLEGLLARFNKEFVDLVLGLDGPEEGAGQLGEKAATAMAPKTADLISDAQSTPTLHQAVDLHDVSGHHRYYGSAA